MSESASRGEPSYPSNRTRFFILLTMMLAVVPTIMSSTMVNVAFTDIMGAYGVGQESAHWLSTGFLSATTVAMLLNAWFVTNFGPRHTFLFALLIFIIGSFAAQEAQSFDMLIMARCVQGFSAGLLQPLTLTVIFPIFPMHQRGRAMGLFSMGITLGPAFGPVLGGIIADELGWRYLFTPMIPIGLLAAALALHWLPRHIEESHRRDFNWTSFVLVTATVVGFLYGTSNWLRLGWDSIEVMASLMGAAICLCLFIAWELMTRSPLLEVRLFLNRNFTYTVIVAFAFGAGMFGNIYQVPLFVRTIQGFDATTAGLLLLPSGLIMLIVFPASGFLAQIWSPRRTVTIGLIIFGTSSLLLSGVDVHTGFWFLALVALYGRIGLGLIIPSLQFHGIRTLDMKYLPYAAGTLNFMRSLGGAIGVNLVALHLDYRLAVHRDYFAASQAPDNSATRELLRRLGELIDRAGLSGLDAIPETYGYLARTMVAQAMTQSFRDGFLLIGAIFLVTILPALLLSGKTVKDTMREEAAAQRRVGTMPVPVSERDDD